MQYLNRSKVYQKHEPAKDAKKVYIFCEGSEREVAYFNYFKGLSSNIDILPIPSVDGQSDPVKLKENAQLLFFGDEKDGVSPTYKLNTDFKDEIWFVIDTDTWQEQGKIAQLKKFCENLNQGKNYWLIAQSNPCFEVWLLYHLVNQRPTDDVVSQYVSFKQYVNAQIPGGVDVRKIPLHLDTAISNSITNFQQVDEYPNIYSTELHNLGEIILSFVSVQLQKAKKMNSLASAYI